MREDICLLLKCFLGILSMKYSVIQRQQIHTEKHRHSKRVLNVYVTVCTFRFYCLAAATAYSARHYRMPFLLGSQCKCGFVYFFLISTLCGWNLGNNVFHVPFYVEIDSGNTHKWSAFLYYSNLSDFCFSLFLNSEAHSSSFVLVFAYFLNKCC